MTSWTLDVFDPAAGRVVALPLSGEVADLTLAPVDGADAIAVVLRCDGEPRACAELPVAAGQRAELRISPARPPHLFCRTGLATGQAPGLLAWPPDAKPAAIPRPRPPADRLDLALVIDATWQAGGPAGGRLLADAEEWAKLAGALAGLVAALAAGSVLRVAVLAFGDARLPHPAAADLQPSFVVAPAHGGFEAFDAAALAERLRRLPPSSGGDLVDAVAEGLAAARDLPWQNEHRKLVLLAGDSPGYSILHPAAAGAAAFARELDVDEVAASLFEEGIEIATLCAPPSSVLPAAKDFAAYTRSQYRRLASLPQWALGRDDLAAREATAKRLLGRPAWLARGPAAGIVGGA